MAFPSYLATATTKNIKTGNVPTIAIGATRKESLDSCRAVGCALLHKKHGGEGGGDNPLCYSQHGTPSFSHAAMVKAHAKGKSYSLRAALASASRAAKMVRLGSIGDPAALSPIDGAYIRKAVRDEGLALVGYTHGWAMDIAKRWRGHIMASCDTMEQADAAIADGWRAVVVLEHAPIGSYARTFTTPGGNKGVVCPAQLQPEIVTCNTCRLCDGSKTGPVVGFIDHSPGKATKRKA
jgi:hypothetical protein